MRLFLSWSGSLSHQMALELRDWFRLVFPTIEPFVSSEDIRKGGQWSSILAENIRGSDRGIICVTKENFEKPWLQYETGALQQSHQDPIVYTLLVDSVRPDQLYGNPLSLFQHTEFEKDDFYRLVETINGDLPSGSRLVQDLNTIYSEFWPKLEKKRNELLGTALYIQNVVFLPDLAKSTSLVAGQKFEDIVFKGPAIVAVLEYCNFIECAFGMHSGLMDSILWERKSGLPSVGTIGLSRCTFIRCSFEGIGFTGPQKVLDEMRKVPLAPTAAPV